MAAVSKSMSHTSSGRLAAAAADEEAAETAEAETADCASPQTDEERLARRKLAGRPMMKGVGARSNWKWKSNFAFPSPYLVDAIGDSSLSLSPFLPRQSAAKARLALRSKRHVRIKFTLEGHFIRPQPRPVPGQASKP